MKPRYLGLVLVLIAASCSSSDKDAQPDGGGQPPAADSGAGAGQSCPWLVECVGGCAENDEACVDGCGAQATPAAVDQFVALVECLQAGGCADEACATAKCTPELTACAGATAPAPDAGAGGVTSAGKCEVSSTSQIPGVPPMRWCWDYQLTASGNHNDGVEHYVYYDATSAGDGQGTCSESAGTFTAAAGGPPMDEAGVAEMNRQNKRRACELQGSSMGVTAAFTEGAFCELGGSLGHCTHQVTNVFDPGTGQVTATTTTSWSVP